MIKLVIVNLTPEVLMIDAQRLKLQAQLDRLKAELENAAADTRISIQREIEAIEARLR
ncbi:hypothetical protein M1116_02390 [Patescibacteria group bacterium]|nr:hypothetical protein [Patescibacteria group bacterium]